MAVGAIEAGSRQPLGLYTTIDSHPVLSKPGAGPQIAVPGTCVRNRDRQHGRGVSNLRQPSASFGLPAYAICMT